MENFITMVSLLVLGGGIIPVIIGAMFGSFITGSNFTNAARSGIIWGLLLYAGSWFWLIYLGNQSL